MKSLPEINVRKGKADKPIPSGISVPNKNAPEFDMRNQARKHSIDQFA